MPIAKCIFWNCWKQCDDSLTFNKIFYLIFYECRCITTYLSWPYQHPVKELTSKFFLNKEMLRFCIELWFKICIVTCMVQMKYVNYVRNQKSYAFSLNVRFARKPCSLYFNFWYIIFCILCKFMLVSISWNKIFTTIQESI